MKRIPSSGTSTGEVDRQLDNTAYDNVVVVKEAIVAVNTVANSITNGNLGQVAGHIVNIDKVADSITNVDAVATDILNIDAVATDLINVNIVATNITNVNTTATNIADVITVSGDILNVDAVANDLVNIDIVATHIGNVDLVASHMVNVDEVALNITDVGSVALNMAEVLLADTHAATATAQALIAINAANSAIVSSLITSAYGNIDWAGFQVLDGDLHVDYFSTSASTPSIVDGEFILTY